MTVTFESGSRAVRFTVFDGIDNNKLLASDKIGTSRVFDGTYGRRDEGSSILSTSSHFRLIVVTIVKDDVLGVHGRL